MGPKPDAPIAGWNLLSDQNSIFIGPKKHHSRSFSSEQILEIVSCNQFSILIQRQQARKDIRVFFTFFSAFPAAFFSLLIEICGE